MKKYLVVPFALIIIFLGVKVLLTSNNIWQMMFASIGMLLFLFGVFREYSKIKTKVRLEATN